MKKETYLKLKKQKRIAKLLGLLTILSLYGCKNQENIKTYDNQSKKDQILELILEKSIITEPNNKNSYTSTTLSNVTPPYLAIPNNNYYNKNNTDIAHRGYKAKENTKEAFILAGEMGFYGCEADVRFDQNGNIVCSHEEVKNGINTTSFEEYLDICKQYGMLAIIDLKYSNDKDLASKLSPEILKIIERKKMLDICVLQTNKPNDIPNIRKHSNYARIWYLDNSASIENIEFIKKYNIECINIKSTSAVTKDTLNRLNENEINVCVWNVFTLKEKERLLNNGATYIMSDNALGISNNQENTNNYLNNTNIHIQIVSPPNVIEYEKMFENNTLRK